MSSVADTFSVALAPQEVESAPHTRRRRQATAVPLPQELGISLSSNSGKLLQWLLRYPFQRVEDWALVMAVDHSTAARQIKQVEQLNLLECVSPSLGMDSSNLYHLNDAGLVTVARLEQADPAALARAWGVDERGLLRLLPRLHALVYLQNVINGLVARAPIALAPLESKMEVNWQWQRDYAHKFSSQHRAERCGADAMVVFHLHPMAQSWAKDQERWYGAFLLLDTGFTGNHDERLLCQRLTQFLRYRESEERISSHRFFPPVLILAQDRRQQELWLRAAREAADALHVHPLAGAIAHVPREMDILSSWPLAWKTLAGAAPARLENLLVAMPREALPPGALVDRGECLASPPLTEKNGSVPLKGNFAARARTVSPQTQSAAAEREAIALLTLHLSRRHLDVLHALYTWPLLNRTELASLLDLREDSTRRYLYELRNSRCLEVHQTADGTRVYLSSRGLRLVAAALGMSVQHVAAVVEAEDFPHRGQRVRLRHDLDNFPHFEAPAGASGIIVSTSGGITVKMDEFIEGAQGQVNCITWHLRERRKGREREEESLVKVFARDCELVAAEAAGTEYGELVQRSIRVVLGRLVDNPAAVHHTAGIYGFFARLHDAARVYGHQVLWWEMGSRCERRYRDHDSWHNLRPDAAMEYEAQGRRLRAWLEWDEGTMTRGNLTPKLEAYATYIRTREWSREGLRTLPVLLVVAPYTKREQLISEMARSIVGRTGLTVYTTTATRITEQGVLDPIWAPTEADPPGVRRRLFELNSATKGER